MFSPMWASFNLCRYIHHFVSKQNQKYMFQGQWGGDLSNNVLSFWDIFLISPFGAIIEITISQYCDFVISSILEIHKKWNLVVKLLPPEGYTLSGRLDLNPVAKSQILENYSQHCSRTCIVTKSGDSGFRIRFHIFEGCTRCTATYHTMAYKGSKTFNTVFPKRESGTMNMWLPIMGILI